MTSTCPPVASTEEVLALVHPEDLEVARASSSGHTVHPPTSDVEYRFHARRADGRGRVDRRACRGHHRRGNGATRHVRRPHRSPDCRGHRAGSRGAGRRSDGATRGRAAGRAATATSFAAAQHPHVEGVELFAAYQPADSAAGVGGDFYDALPLSDGRLAIAVNDVIGHDVEAAVTRDSVRSTLRAQAVQDPRPDRVLRELNRLVCSCTDMTMTTSFYGTYTPWDGALCYANAGHAPTRCWSTTAQPAPWRLVRCCDGAPPARPP